MKRQITIALVITVGIVGFAAYQALIYYDDNFRYGRMRETPAVRPHEEPILKMEAGIVPFKGGETLYRETPADEIKSPLEKGNPKDIELGKTGYLTYCVQCHGKNYDGMGTVGQSFSPLPTDLRTEKIQSLSDGKYFQDISYGTPNGRQPPLATTIRVLERWRIIAYVKSLGIRNPKPKKK